jgi:hypothetical protein
VPIEWTTVIEGGIPILGGLYATALGYGAVSGSQPQPSPPVLKTRSLFRWLGPPLFCLDALLLGRHTYRQCIRRQS